MTRTTRSDTTIEERLMGLFGQWVALPPALTTAVRMAFPRDPATRDVGVIILELWQGQQATRAAAKLSTLVEVSARRVAVRLLGPDAPDSAIENRRKSIDRAVEKLLAEGVFTAAGTGKRSVRVLNVGPALDAAHEVHVRGRLDPGQARATGVMVTGSATGVMVTGSDDATGVMVTGKTAQPGSPRPRCPGSPRPPYLEETSSPPSSGKKKSLDAARAAASAGGPAAPRAAEEPEPDSLDRSLHQLADRPGPLRRRARELVGVPQHVRGPDWPAKAEALLAEARAGAAAAADPYAAARKRTEPPPNFDPAVWAAVVRAAGGPNWRLRQQAQTFLDAPNRNAVWRREVQQFGERLVAADERRRSKPPELRLVAPPRPQDVDVAKLCAGRDPL